MAPAENTVEAKRFLVRVATALYELGSCAKYCIILNQCFFLKALQKCLFILQRNAFTQGILNLMNVVRIQIYIAIICPINSLRYAHLSICSTYCIIADPKTFRHTCQWLVTWEHL